jgi:phospholipase/lecithinase/hemolysin
MEQLSHVLVALLLALVAAEAAGADLDGLLSHYDRVFSFGDSLTDTGNAAILPATAGGPFSRAPYGETYFHHPSGRASDGRLIIDFIGT